MLTFYSDVLTVTFVHCICLFSVSITQLNIRDLSVHGHNVADGGFAILGEGGEWVMHDGLEIVRNTKVNNFSSPFPLGEGVL